MPPDLSKLSNEDLLALRSGDMTKLSNEGLMELNRQSQPARQPGFLERTGRSALEGFKWGGPLGAAIGASKPAEEAYSRAAYNLGGKVTDVTGSPKLGYAANVGMEAIPAFGGAKAAEYLLSPAVRSGARWLMRNAVNPTLPDLATGKADRAVNTLLNERIPGNILLGANVSQSGTRELLGKSKQFTDEVERLIADAEARGITVDRDAIASVLSGTNQKVGNIPGVGPKEQKIVENTRKAFSEQVGPQIPISKAQEMKQAGYKFVKSKNYGVDPDSSETLAVKDLSRGLRQEIEKVLPEVASPNSEASRLFNALNVMERSALRGAINDIGGFGVLAHTPETFFAYTANRSPAFKSLMARIMNASASGTSQLLGGGATSLYEMSKQRGNGITLSDIGR